MYFAAASDWIRKYKKTGKQEVLAIVEDANEAVALIDPEDIGTFGAHLLALEDPSPHYSSSYVLSGPENVTGKRIVQLVEQLTGTKVENSKFRDVDWLNELIDSGKYPESARPSFLAGLEPLWNGKCSLEGTPSSDQAVELYSPKRSITDTLKALIE